MFNFFHAGKLVIESSKFRPQSIGRRVSEWNKRKTSVALAHIPSGQTAGRELEEHGDETIPGNTEGIPRSMLHPVNCCGILQRCLQFCPTHFFGIMPRLTAIIRLRLLILVQSGLWYPWWGVSVPSPLNELNSAQTARLGGFGVAVACFSSFEVQKRGACSDFLPWFFLI